MRHENASSRLSMFYPHSEKRYHNEEDEFAGEAAIPGVVALGSDG